MEQVLSFIQLVQHSAKCPGWCIALKSCSIFLAFLKSSSSTQTPMLLEPWKVFSKSWLGLFRPCGKGSGLVMTGEGLLTGLEQWNGSLELL